MKIKICVKGYVGLPFILNLFEKIEFVSFDVNEDRINILKLKKDSDKKFKFNNFKKKQSNLQIL